MNFKYSSRAGAVESVGSAMSLNAADDTNTLRIAMVLASMSYGGAQRVAALLANHWVKRGEQVCIITFDSAHEDRYDLDLFALADA